MATFLIAHLPVGKIPESGKGMIAQAVIEADSYEGARRKFRSLFPQREITQITKKEDE